MILVFGGTTEGKIVAGILEKHGRHYYYSTKTAIAFTPGPYGKYRSGALTAADLQTFCRAQDIKAIVHASHPFAAVLHNTIDTCARELALPVYRFERRYPERQSDALIRYVASYQEATEWLERHVQGTLLALTGVQTIAPLRHYWEKHHTIFRILPRESSLALARAAGFPVEQLIMEMPGSDLVLETALINTNHIRAILTKDSGESGFISTKIGAALANGIPIVIVERPALPESFIPVTDEASLMEALNRSSL
ncbi:precorrin-6A reductase [Chitinophaga rhizophila]|uniref:Precorrin-6A reductase n=1 Tax=Chitinophaga rhizophila TaxID=2866212 RepID=A0ABS7GHB2_9BACT|nr:precorrin-6A reductase [Chitinophaga rhizophila]MBW8687085.1 precorrin-6A reductase [Chitinophaga rhizophila]